MCNGHNEYRHRIHEIDPRTDDSFRLLANGSLSFKGNIREFHKERGNLIEQYSSGSENMKLKIPMQLKLTSSNKKHVTAQHPNKNLAYYIPRPNIVSIRW